MTCRYRLSSLTEPCATRRSCIRTPRIITIRPLGAGGGCSTHRRIRLIAAIDTNAGLVGIVGLLAVGWRTVPGLSGGMFAELPGMETAMGVLSEEEAGEVEEAPCH